MNLLARPSEWIRSSAGPRLHARDQHYFAFLSYSHRDEATAKWLHDSLEAFRVPSYLVGRLTEHGPVPRRLTPVFRDLHELAASEDLGSEIRQAIAGSRFLVVLCSPDAATSRWTNAEIEAFKRVRPEGCIVAGIVGGEPFASDIAGREDEECFPPALRFHYDGRGRRTTKRAEPLAADLRGTGEARRIGFLKLVAGMLGVGLDDLVQRDTLRRQRRLALATAASIAGMVVTSGLALTAIQARDAARDQRREAEGLIGFMLGDLREKLEPIGRLDALDGVGSRVLDYYEKQDMAELADAALLQRSRALNLMGEVANLRGQTDAAFRFYRAAAAGTAEAIRRDPNDPQRLFDHAQNIFWIGDIARQRGQTRAAEASMREYQRLAQRMLALEPDDMRWRMETQYADANLGIILYEERRFDEAVEQFQRALQTIEALATADTNNADYQYGLAETLAWLADAQMSRGRLQEATAIRERHVAHLRQRLSRTGDVAYRQRLIPAHQGLGNLYFWRGDTEPGLRHLNAAVEEASALILLEPSNTLWQEFGAQARLSLAEAQSTIGRREDASANTAVACRTINGLPDAARAGARRIAALRDCLLMQGRLAHASGSAEDALARANEALKLAAAVRSGDRVADLHAIAQAHDLIGDIRSSAGDAAGARSAWMAAVSILPTNAAERPTEMSQRASLLRQLGQADQAAALRRRLDAMGYRDSSGASG